MSSVNELSKEIIEKIQKEGLEAFGYPSFYAKIPDSPLIISFNRVNEGIYTVIVSENNVILTQENFYTFQSAVNGFFERIADLAAQVKKMNANNNFS